MNTQFGESGTSRFSNTMLIKNVDSSGLMKYHSTLDEYNLTPGFRNRFQLQFKTTSLLTRLVFVL